MALKQTLQSKYKLLSGHEIPILGYGVYMIPPSTTEKTTAEALKLGFRHVDSAIMYRNEKPCESMGYDSTKQAIESSLQQAAQQYFDLILIHAPYGGKTARLGSWRALVEAQKAGKARSIGVSNYGLHHLKELEEYIQGGGGGEISVGQYELHPWLDHSDITEWLQSRGIVVEAYSPLAHGTRFREPVLQTIGKKYNKSPAQVLIRWSLQMGFVPLPKSVTPQRIKENTEVFDFELSAEDMKQLDTGEYSPTDWDPTVDED
ncbi:Aldo/keto reductase subgroup [Penicillium chermesinum]|uniref:D-xylose reductase [NAD(P)H] n=1 Tax=Penicillium chermesinum TaxID=63820 RepID=A0A9W9P932_9EURO|nr:Aldo/keto reductase subgroup [Penicillium chermesinum]KAJ5240104.1 Aldo/keto reductase subgroup [Penicillium chermesinum]